MVLGYICQEHGYQNECDIAESGQRICYECGNAVTGLTGHIRGRNAPPSDKPMYQSGNIRWTIQTHKKRHQVMAFDHEQAVEQIVEKLNNPQEINQVYPTIRKYRR
jgi:hypothetical protein